MRYCSTVLGLVAMTTFDEQRVQLHDRDDHSSWDYLIFALCGWILIPTSAVNADGHVNGMSFADAFSHKSPPALLSPACTLKLCKTKRITSGKANCIEFGITWQLTVISYKLHIRGSTNHHGRC